MRDTELADDEVRRHAGGSEDFGKTALEGVQVRSHAGGSEVINQL